MLHFGNFICSWSCENFSLELYFCCVQRSFKRHKSTQKTLKQKISDSEFGLIVGPIFNIASLTAGVFIGRGADVYSRKYLLFASVIVWTTFHALIPSSTSFWHLVYCQVGLSIGIFELLNADRYGWC
jgi:hypothetical protein